MVGKKTMIDWLAHRAGVTRRTEFPIPYQKEAFELNARGREFVDNFGNQEIKAYVGFVDLVGFTERVKGQTTGQVRDYLEPFLRGLTTLAVDRDALVDKTIGDEVMFILPHAEDHGGPPPILMMGQLMGGMHDFQRELGRRYPMRVGLAHGGILVGSIDGDGYREWTSFGETVHLAKRLNTFNDVRADFGFYGAFGVLASEEDAFNTFKNSLGFIAGSASRMTHEIIKGTVDTLKGASPTYCAYLYPKAPRVQ